MRYALAALLIVVATGCDTCFDAIEEVFPSIARPTAHRIAQRESHEVATAKNPRSSASGCFQLLRTHAGLIPGGWSYRFNPWANSMAALNLYNGSGWRPWAL